MFKHVIATAQVTILLTLCVSTASCAPPETQPAAGAWRTMDARVLAGHLDSVLDNKACAPEYWQTKPRVAATFYYSAEPQASANDRARAARFKAGEFCPHHRFEWLPVGVPPPWDENPFDNNTWDFSRHSLHWVVPLVNTWIGDGDDDSLKLMERLLADWIEHNSVPPGASKYAWRDHATASRLRIMCWFWELWRTSDAYEPELARLLLASIYQHTQCICDPEMYPAKSNHGLEMTGSLLAAALTFPEFKQSDQWEELALRRLSRYFEQNFSPEGFHLEQSPFYHGAVLRRLNDIRLFLDVNGRTMPPGMVAGLRRAAATWPWLLKPNGILPTIGDSPAIKGSLRAVDDELLGGADAVRASLRLPANPRGDDTHFLLSFEAGYAVFTTYSPYEPNLAKHDTDTYIVFKCNSFSSTHCQRDALSFIFYGLGRDWLVDSGQLNYEEKTPARKYMRSARAHNVVLVDGEDFGFRPLKLIDSGRDARGDFVSVRHELKPATHTRTFRFIPPRTIEITDEIESTDGQPHVYTQLYHAAPDLAVETPVGPVAELVADNGDRCRIEQTGEIGDWALVKGQTEPVYQGWYSPKYNELQESAVLYYRTSKPALRCTFQTRITVVPAASAPK